MAGRLRPVLRVAHRRIQALTARELTSQLRGRSMLVVAPHPDDETLGCGGTIALVARSGGPVHVLIVSDGCEGMLPAGVTPRSFAALREAECREACRRLGVPEQQVEFLQLPDATLRDHRKEITDGIARRIHSTEPDIVIAPLARDAHEDHRVVGSVVTDMLVADLAGREVLGYPVWFWNRWAWTAPERSVAQQRRDLLVGPTSASLSSRWRKVRLGDLLETKRHALAAHDSQVSEGLDPDWLEQFLHDEELFLELNRGDWR